MAEEAVTLILVFLMEACGRVGERRAGGVQAACSNTAGTFAIRKKFLRDSIIITPLSVKSPLS